MLKGERVDWLEKLWKLKNQKYHTSKALIIT